MNSKLNGYILLTLFLYSFSFSPKYIEIPLKLLDKTKPIYRSLKCRTFKSRNFFEFSSKRSRTKSCNPLMSYLSKLEGNLFSYEIKIGSNEQIFKVILDTGSSILWVSGTENEEKNNTFSHHYNPKSSKTSRKTNFGYKIRYGSGYSLGYYYNDQIKLFNDTNITLYFDFGVANKTKFDVNGADGVIGLGRNSNDFNSSILYRLKNNDYIEKTGFSIKYNSTLKNAILYFGDEHEDFNKGFVGSCPLASNTENEKKFWSCELNRFGIKYENINVSVNLNLNVVFDTGTNVISLPKYILPFLSNQIKALNCSILNISLQMSNIVCYNKDTFPDIILEIGNYSLTISKKYLYSKYKSNNAIIYFSNIFFQEGIEMGIIGLPFFYEFHTRFDLDKNVIKFFHQDKNFIQEKSSKKYQNNNSNINFKLKIFIAILAFIAFVLFLLVYKYYCNAKKLKKTESIEIILPDNTECLSYIPE